MYQRIVIIILLPLVIVLVNAHFLAYNQSFYEKEFEKHNVYETFKLTKEEVNKENTNILNFLKGKQELTTAFLNQKEKQHLQDVKDLIRKYKIIEGILFLLAIFFIIKTRDKKAVLYGSILTIILLTVSLMLIAMSFTEIFLIFHKISFSNDLWLLDPGVDNLIKLFPEPLFYDWIFTVVKNSLMSALLLIIGINFYQSIKKRKSRHTT